MGVLPGSGVFFWGGGCASRHHHPTKPPNHPPPNHPNPSPNPPTNPKKTKTTQNTIVEVLNARFGVLGELLEVLRANEQHQHSSRLEWIIIILVRRGGGGE